MGLVMQDFMCKDMFGNICATVTSSTLEHARAVFDAFDWAHLYAAETGTSNYEPIGMRLKAKPHFPVKIEMLPGGYTETIYPPDK